MFRTILVPTDGTSMSSRPMEAAIEMARQSSGKLVVVSVAEPRLFNSIASDAANDSQMAEAINIKTAESNVKKALTAAEEVNIPWEAIISMSSKPCEAILEMATRFQCDLIVMATQGKMGLLDTLFNESTTQSVLQKSRIPVLVFPQE